MTAQLQQRGGEGSAGKPPLTAHPAFPLIVGLWFAVLLGLGSLILPPLLVERIILLTRLPDVLPAAAPPLGLTARSLLALAATLVGGLAGFWLARQMNRNPGEYRTPRQDDPRAAFRRQPINAREELGEQGLDWTSLTVPAAAPAARRRARALADADANAEWQDSPPPPAQVREQGAEPYAEFAEVAEFGEPETDAAPCPAEAADNPPPAEASLPIDLADIPAVSVNRFTLGQDMAVQDESSDQAALGDALDPAELEDAGLEDAGLDTATQGNGELDEEQDRDMDGKQVFDAYAAPDTGTAPLPPSGMSAVMTDLPTHMPLRFVDTAAGGAPEPDASASPAMAVPGETGQPGLVQLVQRLEATLARHRDWSARRAAEAAAAEAATVPEQSFPRPVPGPFDVAEPDEAAMAKAAYFGAASAAAAPQDSPAANPDESRAVAVEDMPPLPPAAPMRYKALQDYGLAIGPTDDHAGADPFANDVGADDDCTDDEGDADLAALAASLTLPLTALQAGTAAAAPFATEAALQEPDPEGTGDPDYGSLLAVRQQLRDQPAVAEDASRSFDPPSERTAPGQPAAAPAAWSSEETGQALREALLNLQRMGKGN